MHSRRTKLIALGIIFVIVVVGSYFFVKHEFTERAKEQINAKIQEVSPAVTISYRRISTEPLTRKVTLKDVVIEPPKVTGQLPMKIRSISFDFRQNRAGELTDLNAWIKEAKSPVVLDQKTYPALYELTNQLDRHQVVSDITLKYHYDATTQIATIYLVQDIRSLAKIRFSLQVGNFIPDSLSLEQARIMTLNSVSFKYIDESFLRQLIKIKASQVNLDETTYVQNLVSIIEGKAALASNSFFQQLYMQVAKLIQNPGTLEISATPAQPIKIFNLYFGKNKQDILNQLNLQVTSAPPSGSDAHAA